MITTRPDHRKARHDYDAERQKRRKYGGSEKGNHAIKVETNVTHLLRLQRRDFCGSRHLLHGAWLVMVEVEAVSVEILYGELS